MTLSKLVHVLAQGFHDEGFTRKGACFSRQAEGLDQLVWYQSRRAEASLFTITMEASITAISTGPKGLPFWDPHLQARVGELLGMGDIWWPVPANKSDVDDIVETQLEVRAAVLSKMNSLSDRSLVGEWLADRGTGISLKQERTALAAALSMGIRP